MWADTLESEIAVETGGETLLKGSAEDADVPLLGGGTGVHHDNGFAAALGEVVDSTAATSKTAQKSTAKKLALLVKRGRKSAGEEREGDEGELHDESISTSDE